MSQSRFLKQSCFSNCRWPVIVADGGGVKASPETEELELIHRSQAGDAEAFGELVTTYRAKIFTMLYGRQKKTTIHLKTHLQPNIRTSRFATRAAH